MIINYLEITNFRQFYDTNKIVFGKDDKNITIVQGVNGSGKTGIFRALMFVLYGDQTLSQDPNNGDIHLINSNKLEEANGGPVSAKVTINFNYRNNDYTLTRVIKGFQNGQNINDEVQEPDLFYKSDTGDFERSNEDVDLFISRIIKKDIREFFFFDAEQMDFFQSTASEKSLSQHVKTGVEQLLQLKSLSDSEKILNSMISDVNEDISKQSDDELLKSKINEKEQKQIELDKLNAELDNNQKEKTELDKELASINKKLASNKDNVEQLDKLDKAKGSVEIKNETKRVIIESFQDKYLPIADQIALPILKRNIDYFKKMQEERKDAVPYDLITLSLEHKRCELCDSPIVEGSEQYQYVKNLKENYQYTVTTQILREIINVEMNLDHKKDKVLSDIKKKMANYFKTDQEIDQLQRDIEQLKASIKDSNIQNSDLKVLEEQKYLNESKIERIQLRIESDNSIKDQWIKLLKDLDLKITELSRQYKELDRYRKVSDKLQAMKNIIEKVTTEYTNDVLQKISQEMTNILKEILDLKNGLIFSKIIITKNFDIELLDSENINRINDLSKGQAQVFTLAFILSLAKLASKGRDEINFPLFMDTPFGRLDHSVRDNLVRTIPKLTNQWILLMTDTELGNSEIQSFEQLNKVGKIYKLESFAGKSIIKEVPKLDFLKITR